MASLGSLILLLAFLGSAYAAAASVAGARRGAPRLAASGMGAFHTVTALMTVASGLMVHAFVTGDYTIRYVQRYSNDAQPLFYKITSYWGGLDGSVMFWVFLLGVFGSVAVHRNRDRHRELVPYVVAVIAAVEMFFLFLMIVHNNPFATYLTETHADGRGLNPLLQNFYMAIHPPTMYLGFVGLTIPYAFGMAALVTGHLDDAWLRAVRRWTMIAWFFLSLGLVLGMIWAYEELGWGGYWGWDPVENAGLLPWFTATAFLHSVMVQERRGMLRVWNVTLVILTFLLTIFGTFMTRSGVVQSVHAFGEDRDLAWLFTVFMILIVVVSFGLVLYRLPLLRARHELDSWLSREAAFLANNWVLLFSALFVLFATMFPTLSEALTGERLTVGPPFFNRWMLPIGLALLLLTGIGPLLAWRKTTASSLVRQFLYPVLAGIAAGSVMVALGVPVWASGVAFALCAFVAGTIVQEFVRGGLVRQASTGTDLLTAIVGLVGRNRRRYGGYIVHLGVVLMFVGFAGEGFGVDEQAVLRPGQSVAVRGYQIRLDAIRVTEDAQKQMVTGHITVMDAAGRELGRLYPARWFYFGREQEPTTEVAIRRTFAEDLYLVMPAFDLGEQTASVEIHVNPLVNWIWVGFGIMAVGTGIALLPERAYAFALGKVPAEAAAALLLVALLLWPGAAAAQHVDGAAPTGLVVRSPVERAVGKRIICMCGTCGRQLVGECTCGYAAQMRDEIRRLAEAGHSEDEIVQYYIDKYGSQEPLAAPLDRGFNRLAWLFPYLAGAVGAVIVAVTARRWSRRAAAEAPASAGGSDADPELQARLDDELRDLD